MVAVAMAVLVVEAIVVVVVGMVVADVVVVKLVVIAAVPVAAVAVDVHLVYTIICESVKVAALFTRKFKQSYLKACTHAQIHT